MDGNTEAHLIAISCNEPPRGFSKWQLRMLADKMVELEYVESLSYETVRRVFKKNEIKPWRVKGWIILPKQSAEFVANMKNVLDVCKRPFSKDYPVACMDESPKQLIKNSRLSIKMVNGMEKRVDYEYARCWVCNIFMTNELLKGHRMVKITERETKKDWAVFI